jgi:hypothetical protein
MRPFSDKIYKQTLKEISEKYDLSEKSLQVLLKLYTDYMFFNINKLDLQKDLTAQTNRFLFPGVGQVYVNKLVLIENDVAWHKISEKDYKFTVSLFNSQWKRVGFKVQLYRNKIKFNNPWANN